MKQLAALLVTLWSSAVMAATEGGVSAPEYSTIVVIGDTQDALDQYRTGGVSADRYAELDNVIDWIVANEKRENIEFVIHVGDMIQHGVSLPVKPANFCDAENGGPYSPDSFVCSTHHGSETNCLAAGCWWSDGSDGNGAGCGSCDLVDHAGDEWPGFELLTERLEPGGDLTTGIPFLLARGNHDNVGTQNAIDTDREPQGYNQRYSTAYWDALDNSYGRRAYEHVASYSDSVNGDGHAWMMRIGTRPVLVVAVSCCSLEGIPDAHEVWAIEVMADYPSTPAILVAHHADAVDEAIVDISGEVAPNLFAVFGGHDGDRLKRFVTDGSSWTPNTRTMLQSQTDWTNPGALNDDKDTFGTRQDDYVTLVRFYEKTSEVAVEDFSVKSGRRNDDPDNRIMKQYFDLSPSEPLEAPFVALADSTTFGSGATIFDATTRVVPKVYHGPPPSNASYANTVTMTDSCSSDSTTQNTLANLISASHANNVSDNTVIVLPPSCRINLFMTPGYDDTVVLTLANKYDNVKLYCANRTTCGFRNNFSSPRDETLNNRATSLQIGASGITGTSQSYSLVATSYTWGSKMVQSASAIDVTDTGDGLAWGPGDIVEIRLGRITGYGSNTPDWMTRITCIRDNSGNLYGSDCTHISGNNQFQLADVPPLNLHPNAYFWGNEGLGSAFTPHSSEGGNLSGTYAATSGHEIHQVERMGTTRCGVVGDGSVCGRGTETNNVPENIWLENISFTVADNVLGTRYLIGANWYGGGAYKVQVDRTVGRVSAFTFGNRSNGWRVSHLSLHSMAWTGTGANVKCIGKILAVNATDPVTVDVQTYVSPAPYNRVECDSVRSIADNADASPDSSNDPNWSEPEVQFSWDVADSRLAGKRFLISRSYIGGSPATNRLTLTGFNASSLSPALDTTVAGYAANIDRYGGASFYLNDSSSYVQVINSWFENTAQHAIMQGCAACVYAHNFVTSIGSEAEGGRGPFNHANRGESGNTYEGNDQSHAMILLDSGNGEPVGHGEGTNHAYCMNRKRASPTLTWPQGTAVGQDYGANASFALLATGQNGAANDDWLFMLNSSETSLWSGTIDNCDNDDTDPSGTGDSTCVTASRQPNEPPAGQLFQPAVYRNRCATCNQDSNFRTATGSPQWGTPFTDVRAFEYGDSSPAPVAPFTDERSGAPQSCFLTETPEYWCAESGFVGQMGANWDDWNNPSTIKEIPAHIAYKIARGFGGTCTPVN